ncbi:MAG: DMT family transporter [Gammaproteobacteria bacterium]|nr:DMT family transporter [Gammaproteobacteria bacterium]
MRKQPNTGQLGGILAVITAMALYATNFIASRYSIQAGLSAYDLTALRYLSAGLLLLPVLIRYGLRDLAGIGWQRGFILAVLAGAPYMTEIFVGLEFSPAAHGAVLNPGFVPVVAAIGMWLVDGIAIRPVKQFALLLIIIGLGLVTSFSFSNQASVLFGDFLFLLSGLSWGVFTVLIRHWRLDPWRVAIVVSVLSMLYLPVYSLFMEPQLSAVSFSHILAQATFQGLGLSILALFLFGYGVKTLGPHHAAVYSPLVPIIASLVSLSLLGENLLLSQWFGILLVVCGMYLAAKFS